MGLGPLRPSSEDGERKEGELGLRDRLVEELRKFGYQLQVPERTFYLMVRSPWENDWAFAEMLATLGILVHPGSLWKPNGDTWLLPDLAHRQR